jgi:hypothetical protein
MFPGLPDAKRDFRHGLAARTLIEYGCIFGFGGIGNECRVGSSHL